MGNSIRYIGRVVIFGLVFMIMRSPFAMGITGFAAGIAVSHFYPEQTQRGIFALENGINHIISGESLQNAQYDSGQQAESQTQNSEHDEVFRRTIEGM
jgi:hypothetical protein